MSCNRLVDDLLAQSCLQRSQPWYHEFVKEVQEQYLVRGIASRKTLTGLRGQVIDRIHATSLIQADVDLFKSWGSSASVLQSLALVQGVVIDV